MQDDKTISQLISQSLRQNLAKDEADAVDSRLEDCDESKKFAELSRLIQDSVRGLQVKEETVVFSEDNTEVFEFSPDIRERLKQTVSSAIEEKLSLSQAGLIVPEATNLEISDFAERHSGQPHEAEDREIVTTFKLIRKLGEGGHGTVWLARDNKLNRNIAIKELKMGALESTSAWDRFHREAEITGNLEHPNIVPLYLYGLDRASGQPFYAMRFVGKKNLSAAIEEYHDKLSAGETDPLSLHRLLTVFLDICQAIAYAHSRGVIHRDLKPQNIALDNFGQVIVIDWGLAKVIEDSELALKMTCNSQLSDSVIDQTIDGEVIGTPLYMSPEQASGDIDRIDTRTDVYGLGAILFAILTGYAPHEKSTSLVKENVESFIKAVAKADPPKASDYGQAIPQDLEAICRKAMAHKSHLRYETVQSLAEAVETWMAGQSTKPAAFEKLRMEGRELRTDMTASMRDLERNVRFCSALPPIDGLVQAKTEEDVKVWRKRLSQIYEGILNANPDYLGVVFCRIENGLHKEVVRVERQQKGSTGVRVVPKSRLREIELNDYHNIVMSKLPGEVHTSLVCGSMCELSSKGVGDKVGLLSSVPVFDSESEEIYGFVAIMCDVEKMLRQQLQRCMSANEVIVACDVFHVVSHKSDGRVVDENQTKPVKEVAPYFLPAIQELQENLDFEDLDSQIYGVRLWLNPDRHGIMYLLRRTS